MKRKRWYNELSINERLMHSCADEIFDEHIDKDEVMQWVLKDLFPDFSTGLPKDDNFSLPERLVNKRHVSRKEVDGVVASSLCKWYEDNRVRGDRGLWEGRSIGSGFFLTYMCENTPIVDMCAHYYRFAKHHYDFMEKRFREQRRKEMLEKYKQETH